MVQVNENESQTGLWLAAFFQGTLSSTLQSRELGGHDLVDVVAIVESGQPVVMGQPAELFVGLANNETGRLFSCETSEWSDWFSYAEESF